MYLPQNTGGEFETPPSGTHVAVCYRIVDLGTQQTDYQGQIKHQRKVMLSWELPDEKMADGRPFTIHQRYTLSSNEKSRLRQDLESWRGAKFTDADFGPGGFDIRKILGVGCLLSIIHDNKQGKTYANISALSRLPKTMVAPPPTNPKVYFSLDSWDDTAFEALSEGLRNTIKKSPEYIELHRPAPSVNGGHVADHDERNPPTAAETDAPF